MERITSLNVMLEGRKHKAAVDVGRSPASLKLYYVELRVKENIPLIMVIVQRDDKEKQLIGLSDGYSDDFDDVETMVRDACKQLKVQIYNYPRLPCCDESFQ